MGAKDQELVRCVGCRHEYALPARGEVVACPSCGSRSWVSSRIARLPAETAGK